MSTEKCETDFAQCLTSLEDPSNTMRETVLEVLSDMFSVDDSCSSQLLRVLIEHVLFYQSPSSFHHSDWKFRRWAESYIFLLTMLKCLGVLLCTCATYSRISHGYPL
jgi:hypothetical protein